jgi:hypothetical protein
MKKSKSYKFIFVSLVIATTLALTVDLYFNSGEIITNPKSLSANKDFSMINESLRKVSGILSNNTNFNKRDALIENITEVSQTSSESLSPYYNKESQRILSDLKSIKVIDVHAYSRQLQLSLNTIREILTQRKFRQRSTIQSANEELSILTRTAVDTNRPEKILDFKVTLDELTLIINDGKLPRDVSTEIKNDLNNLSFTLQQYERELVDAPIIRELGDDYAKLLINEQSTITNLVSSELTDATQFLSATRTRFLAYVMVFIGLGIVHVLFMFNLLGIRVLSHQKLKKRLNTQLKEIRSTKAKVDTIEEDENIMMALITPQGKISWSTKGFKKIFNSKSARKKGWSFLQSEYLIKTNDIGNMMKSYILKSRPDHELVITSYQKNHTSELRTIVIHDAVDYFSDLTKREFSSHSLSGLNQPEQDGHQIIDKLIEESLMIIPSVVQNNNIYLEFANRIPRTARTNPRVIEDLVTTLFDMCHSGTNIFGTMPVMKIDYELKDSFISISFKFKDVSLDQRALSTPFVNPSVKNNAWEYLTDIESRHESVRLSVSIKNIKERKSGYEDSWGCIETTFMVNLPPVINKKYDIEPMIRSGHREFNV